jgi:hypothetical protein
MHRPIFCHAAASGKRYFGHRAMAAKGVAAAAGRATGWKPQPTKWYEMV